MSDNNENNLVKKDILIRMRRIEGQVKGIQKMVEGDACCRDLLVQIAAVRAAINKVGTLILHNYTENCFFDDELSENEREKLTELIKTINMFIK